MKTYSIAVPQISGILSDDYLYFEGASRPSLLMTLKDEDISSVEDILVLEKYLNDIYNLFLRKISNFMGNVEIGDEDSIKLQALLQEIIKVKGLIENTPKTAIMSE